MTISMNAPIVIRSFGFNIPCRRFLLRVNVTRDKRLPIVDEFILRLLKICEELSIRRIGSFFGFAPAELEKVISDLVGSGLITVAADRVRLHPSAHEHFRGSLDGTPHVLELESWPVRIWFDLISKNMAAPGTRSARNLIDVRPANLARDLPATYAKSAFEENFADYLRRVRRMPNPERLSLYSVPEAVAERFGSLVLPVDQELVFDPEPKLQPNLVAIKAEDMPRLRQLANAVLDQYRGLYYMEPSPAALSEFAVLSNNGSVTDAHGGTATFDLPAWLAMNPGADAMRQPVIGVAYLRRNIDALTKLIHDFPDSEIERGAGSTKEIVWYRPGGSAWGCSPELRDAIRSIKTAIRRKFGRSKIRTSLIVPEVSRKHDSPRRFDGLFDVGLAAPEGLLKPSIEILHIPGVAAMLLVDVSLSEVISIPVGFACAAALVEKQITKSLAGADARFDELWHRQQVEEDEPADMEPEEDERED